MPLCLQGAGRRNSVPLGGGRGGGQRQDAHSLEEGEAENSHEQVDDEGQAGQAQVDGASGSPQFQNSHSGGKRVEKR